MSMQMYKPDKQSKAYIYIVFFSAAFIAIAAYYNYQSLRVQNQCTDIALKTAGLTKQFKYDPYSSFDYVKAVCESEVLSSSK